MRQFTLDIKFSRGDVLKTPFRGDVARVYLRPDDCIVVQHRGSFRPFSVPGDTPLEAVLGFASNVLDNWDSHIN